MAWLDTPARTISRCLSADILPGPVPGRDFTNMADSGPPSVGPKGPVLSLSGGDKMF